ncbi:IQ calmodulin-binding motif-containing protein 1-like [Dysidea avara]|uniref:IQ calmodulin-binding motif-containing protein 1-like n=1 Tax=Dysidea avara TaxID=196820 RepID=UPI00333454CC
MASYHLATLYILTVKFACTKLIMEVKNEGNSTYTSRAQTFQIMHTTSVLYLDTMDSKDVLSEVARIAEKVVSSEDSQAPLILLELKHVYQQCPRNSLRILKMNVWHYGLVHILIELLGQNFSLVKGQWATAAQLGSILSHTLSGLHPEKLKKTNLDASQIEEYYDGVLPTALHSLLVLSNNVLNLRDSAQVFPGLLENIAKLCQSHHILLAPLLQSPYLLHMLSSSSDGVTLQVLLSFIKKMLTITDSVIPSLSLDVIHNYTDELVQRITSSSELILALEVFSVFLELPDIAESVAARYQGLTQFLSSLQVDSPTVDIRWMIEILGGTSRRSSVGQSENLQNNNLTHAAIVIQSHWRGYHARKKVKAIHRGIIAFQRLYRKAKVQREKPQHNLTEDMKQESQHIALRMFHEKQFKIIEQLPAKDVDNFLKQLQESSAVKIQKWWRDCNQTNINKKLTKPKKKSTGKVNQQASTHNKESVLLQIDQTSRDRLQAEISHYQSHRPVIHKSRTTLQQLHTEVQKQLQVMYLDRTLEKERIRKRKLLLNQLEVDSASLLGAPSLEKAQPNNIAQFTINATGITHMARLAHEEELKSLELPWWKRTNFDSEEIDFDN